MTPTITISLDVPLSGLPEELLRACRARVNDYANKQMPEHAQLLLMLMQFAELGLHHAMTRTEQFSWPPDSDREKTRLDKGRVVAFPGTPDPCAS